MRHAVGASTKQQDNVKTQRSGTRVFVASFSLEIVLRKESPDKTMRFLQATWSSGASLAQEISPRRWWYGRRVVNGNALRLTCHERKSTIVPAGFRDGHCRGIGLSNGESTNAVEVADSHQRPVLYLHTSLDGLSVVNSSPSMSGSANNGLCVSKFHVDLRDYTKTKQKMFYL